MAVTFDFDHDLQTVFETLTDPQFLVDRCIALGELDAECEVEEDGDAVILTMVREIQRDLPKVLDKVFGGVQTTDFTEEWRPHKDGWKGHWTMSVRGQPVTVDAEFQLQPTAKGCRYSVSHSAKAKIPLLGGQVEKFILGATTGGATDELNYLKEFLG